MRSNQETVRRQQREKELMYPLPLCYNPDRADAELRENTAFQTSIANTLDHAGDEARLDRNAKKKWTGR